LLEAKALLNAIAPSRTASGVGSAPTSIVVVMAGGPSHRLPVVAEPLPAGVPF
jgi:hypothetical protein